MAESVELRADVQRSLAFGSIIASYTAIGNAFERPMRILNIQNLTDATLQFSFDGVNDHFVLPSGGFFLIDITTNKIEDRGFYVSKGTTMHVKRFGTPTVGSVYVIALYARGS